MDFSDTASEAAFRAEARAWLLANAQEYAQLPAAPWRDEELVAKAKAWQRRKAEAGFAGVTLPRSVGGRGGSPMEALIFAEEEARYRIPTGPFMHVGVQMTVPALLAHANAAQIEQLATATLRGDVVWCQLYSEPGAGSDLAGIRSRAVRNGSNWILNGQKVWSSWRTTHSVAFYFAEQTSRCQSTRV
jgi:alkylation response protein AidB-like acyl-CoA dehydrogenase